MTIKVAWFSPLPPQPSGISEYCMDLLPYLKPYMEIDLFVEDPATHQGTLLEREFPIHPYTKFQERRRRWRYDLNIYQMGNNILHRFVYLTLVQWPGLVVLHEPMLHHFMLEMLQAGWTPGDYSRELDYNYGVHRDGVEETVDGDGTEQSRFRYPMLQRVIDSSFGVIVHSDFAAGEVLGHRPPGPVKEVSMPYIPDPETVGLTRGEARRRLGLNEDTFLVGTFGFVNPTKRIESILDALAGLLVEAPEARLAVVGGHVPEYPVGDVVARHGLSERVMLPGRVDWADFLSYMVACDMCVALRWPSAGETPSSVVRLLGLGCPTVMSDSKAFGEFSENVCLKVTPGRETEELLGHLLRGYRDREMLDSMGERAREYIRRDYGIEDTARSYWDFAVSLLTGGGLSVGRPDRGVPGMQARESLVGTLTGKLAGMGIGKGTAGVNEGLSRAVDGIIPPAGA